jgi:hypothetical protein
MPMPGIATYRQGPDEKFPFAAVKAEEYRPETLKWKEEMKAQAGTFIRWRYKRDEDGNVVQDEDGNPIR